MEIKENEAVDRAINYLKSLPQEPLENPENPRLEEIHRLNGKWVVVLSYLTKGPQQEGMSAKKFADLLQYHRQFKEFQIDAKSGQIIVMRNP